MRAGSLFMWWLKKQQDHDQRELERPVLYAPIPEDRPHRYEDSKVEDEEKESPRVIIIDL